MHCPNYPKKSEIKPVAHTVLGSVTHTNLQPKDGRMSSKSERLSSLLLMYFLGTLFVLAPLPSNAEPSGKTSTQSMTQEYSPVYQAIEEAEEALRALREKRPDQATEHADKAVSKAKVRSRSVDTTGMSAEQTKQLADGLTPLETAVEQA